MEPVEETAEVEPMVPDPVSAASADLDEAGIKTEEPESEAADEDSTDNKKSVPCTAEQLTLLSQRLGVQWKVLAPKLGFGPDEVKLVTLLLLAIE